MTTRTLVMSLGLGPKNANEDLNVNETSISPDERFRSSHTADTIGTRLTLGVRAPFASSTLKLEPEAHGGVTEEFSDSKRFRSHDRKNKHSQAVYDR